MSLILALLAQVGPFVTPGQRPVSPLPPEIIERKRQEEQTQQKQPQPPQPSAQQQEPAASSELGGCLDGAESDPLQAVEYARAWLQRANGAAASEAGHCLGVALGYLDRWAEAESAFLAARDTVDAGDRVGRARLGAMAGNAALARGAAAPALAALDAARANALAVSDKMFAGSISIDRARALVALKRDAEAADALAEARAALPGSAQAWLLSATLSRRMGKLAEAQAQIEKAAELLPIDPEIGLEAGVIAVLSGRDEAARKSWQSVIDAAPKSQAATTARGYLAQLGPVSDAQP